MSSKIEPNVLGDGIKWEESNDYSRKALTVLSGQTLALLAVIGLITVAVPATGTAGTNTGNGTCGSVAGKAKTIPETFTLKCTTAATNGGTFSVVGSITGRLKDASVGVAYDSEYLGFTIADGTTDFAVGDTFTIAIAAGSGKAVALDPDGVDGRNRAAGIMVGAVDASAADKPGAAIVRDAMVAPDYLVWPAGITSDEKAAALADLEKLGIVAVTSA